MSTDAATTVRDAQGELVRERLIGAAVALIEAGEEPSMRAVAAKGGVAERTIYRYFESREALFLAVRPRLVGKAGVPLCSEAAELEAYAAALYATFERHRALNLGLLTAPWATGIARITRKANLDALTELLDRAFPGAPRAERKAAAASLRALLSGASWMYLTVSCELALEEAIASVQWNVRVALERLRSGSKRPQGRKRK